MKDYAFQRWRDIERMLLSGKKLTISEKMKMYGVGRKAIRRDFDIIGEELSVITKQGYDGDHQHFMCQRAHDNEGACMGTGCFHVSPAYIAH